MMWPNAWRVSALFVREWVGRPAAVARCARVRGSWRAKWPTRCRTATGWSSSRRRHRRDYRGVARTRCRAAAARRGRAFAGVRPASAATLSGHHDRVGRRAAARAAAAARCARRRDRVVPAAAHAAASGCGGDHRPVPSRAVRRRRDDPVHVRPAAARPSSARRFGIRCLRQPDRVGKHTACAHRDRAKLHRRTRGMTQPRAGARSWRLA